MFEKTPTVIFTLGSRFLNICFGLPSLKGKDHFEFTSLKIVFLSKIMSCQAVRRLFSGARKISKLVSGSVSV